jgi:hypothetical protein
MQSFEGIDVGRQIQVQLTFEDVARGFIDFKRIGRSGGKRWNATPIS